MGNKQSRLSIAIVGAGISGLASGIFLARAGHSVTLFERFDKPRSVGAGLLLQPIGLQVLERLGLSKRIQESAARIDRLVGTNQRGTKVMDMRYKDLRNVSTAFGLGIHRASLFSALYDEAIDSGVQIKTGIQVEQVFASEASSKITYRDQAGFERTLKADAAVIANGTFSELRKGVKMKQRFKVYPWGALWAVLDNTSAYSCELEQKYFRASKMLGILPCGKHPESGRDVVSFFWSLPVASHRDWLASDFAQWKAKVLEFAPEYEDVLDQLKSASDLTFATYGDVYMRQWHDQNVVCIGDAAHGMSPQLGMGANLALVDACVLSDCLTQCESIVEAFKRYSQRRRGHLNYFRRASQILTPMFQSHSSTAAWLRDITLPMAKRVPIAYQEALRTLSGVKTGLLFDSSVDLSDGESYDNPTESH